MEIFLGVLSRFIFAALLIVFASAPAVYAQLSVSYTFLEVVDSKNKPIAGAVVETDTGHGNAPKTNSQGRLEQGMKILGGDHNTRTFTVSKSGYYVFEDYFGIVQGRPQSIRIELLLIPKNKAERKLIGDEQRKRELFTAARNGNAKIVRGLLKSGLSPHLTTSDLRGVPAPRVVSLFAFAASSGSRATISELIAAGAGISRKDKPEDRRLATDEGLLTDYLETGPKLYPADNSAEDKLLLADFEQGVQDLVKAGAAIDPDGSGVNLYISAVRSYNATIEFLVEKGIDINLKSQTGETPLMMIARAPQNKELGLATVQLLLRLGADPNSSIDRISRYGLDRCQTPLLSAVERGDLEMVKLLLANKADPNLMCGSGKTALSLAAERNYLVDSKIMAEITRQLVSAGAR